MNTETENFEFFFSLIEKRGEKTDQLISEIIKASKEHNIYENLDFVGIYPVEYGTGNDNKITYSINVPTPITEKASNIVAFLVYIFTKMFDKFPAFTEPDII